MAYRGNNYSLVIDSHFQPFTMQEMLVPFAAYKEAYEKDEAAYIDLRKQADKFKYLSETLPENSEAKRLYEGYANRLNTAAQDFSTHGRGMSNMRDLFNLKADYEGTIGMLDKADTNLQKELELRRQMSAKDPSMLWSTPTENLNIDSYLYGKTPNNFGISGDALYAAGAQAAQSASKRKFVYNDKETTLGGYFYDIVQKLGYGPEAMEKFANDINTIPELKAQYDNIVKSYNLDDNLTGGSRGAADTQIIRGMMDGALYTEQHKEQRNYDELTKSEKTSFALQKENMDRQAAAKGLIYDAKNKAFKYDIRRDPSHAADLWMWDIDANGNVKGLSDAAKAAGITLGSNGKAKANATSNPFGVTDPNPELNKIIKSKGSTSNGTVITGSGANTSTIQIDMSAGARYEPFYGDALFRHAEHGFATSFLGGFSESDAKPYSIDRLKSNKAKDQLRDYVKGLLPDVVDGLSTDQLDKVIGWMNFQRDYDALSDNHFRLSVPGVDAEGKVVDKTAFNSFLGKVNRMKIDTARAVTGIVDSSEESGKTITSIENDPDLEE